MSIECDIHFNTSFRSILIPGKIPTFLSEGFCELYGAGPLLDYVSELNSTTVQYFRGNKKIKKDPYGNELKMYSLMEIVSLLERIYSQYLSNIESGLQSKSSLTVCLGILKAILANSIQSENDLVVMLYFH